MKTVLITLYSLSIIFLICIFGGCKKKISIYTDEYLMKYAQTNYRKGKQHFDNADYIKATQCFLNSVQTDCSDHNVKGRSFCNLGVICYMAEEKQLALDFYEKSAEEFLLADDTSSYYFALNDIASVYAVIPNEKETMTLYNRIIKECKDSSVIYHAFLTRAQLELNQQHYDSAIFYANQQLYQYENEPTGLLIKAQAFSYLNNADSALCYAQKVMQYSNYCNDKYNALYILSHYNQEINKEQILKLTSQREDIHNQEIDTLQKKLYDAVQIVKAENKTVNRTKQNFIITLFIILIFMGLALGIRQYRKNKLKNENKIIGHRNKIIKRENYILNLKKEKIQTELENHKQNFEQIIRDECLRLRQSNNFKQMVCWNDDEQFYSVIDNRFNNFASKLKMNHLLTKSEIQLCVLVLIGFKQKQIAAIMIYAESGIGKLKYNAAKKLGTTAKNLQELLFSIVFQ